MASPHWLPNVSILYYTCVRMNGVYQRTLNALQQSTTNKQNMKNRLYHLINQQQYGHVKCCKSRLYNILYEGCNRRRWNNDSCMMMLCCNTARQQIDTRRRRGGKLLGPTGWGGLEFNVLNRTWSQKRDKKRDKILIFDAHIWGHC